MNLIQIKRGNKSNLPILESGEPAFAVDTQELFIGDGSENYQVSMHNEYNPNTVLKADSNNNPIPLSVNENTIIARKSGGSIDALSGSDILNILSGTATNSFSFNNQRVTSVPDPFNDNDVANKKYVDNVDHNSLNNYLPNQHIDHSNVSITGSGLLSGGGDLTSSRTISLNNSDIDHNSLNNCAENQHIDHSNVSITGQNGLSGGGDLTDNRVISLDINSLETSLDTNADNDYICFYDSSDGVHKNITPGNLMGTINYPSISSDGSTIVDNASSINFTGGGDTRVLISDDGDNKVSVNVSSRFYTAGTGLSLRDHEFSTDDANIDHNSLNNYVENEHIDWTNDVSKNINDNNINKTAITQYSYNYSGLSLNIDDTPVEDETNEPISSNWAYDHTNATSETHGAGSNTLLHSGSIIYGGDFA